MDKALLVCVLIALLLLLLLLSLLLLLLLLLARCLHGRVLLRLELHALEACAGEHAGALSMCKPEQARGTIVREIDLLQRATPPQRVKDADD